MCCGRDPGLCFDRRQSGHERQAGETARLVHRDKLRGGVERVRPAIIKRIRRGRRSVRRKTELPWVRPIIVEILKSRLNVAERNAGGRQDTPVVLRVLMDNLLLPPPTQAREVGHIDWIATALVVQVAQDRLPIFTPRILG